VNFGFIRGLLFDNDGVLVDSRPAVDAAWNRWAQEFGVAFQMNETFHGRRAEDIVRLLLNADQFERGNERINELEQETADQTSALDGAVALTSSLPEGSWTVVTSANPQLARARLAAAGIPIPPALVTAADVAKGKPNPDPYLLGAERLSIPIENCVVFEDAPAGYQAGVAAGAGLVVGVGPLALETEAQVVVKSLEGIKFSSAGLEIIDSARLR
jgi:sugar-phosphatase